MARLKGQLFARLALDYFDHPKIAALSPEAIVAHLQMIVYARKYGTNGAIPMAIAMRFASQVLDELASNDPDNPSIIINDDGTVTIHGYADMQETAEQVQARRQARAEAGRKGAQSRWQGDGNSHSKSHGKRDGKTMAETETETETDTLPSRKRSETTPEGFDAWWAQWPKKVAKAAALKAYKTALKKTDALTLGQSAAAFIAAEKRKGTAIEYIPNASTWLNQERWEDDTSTPTAMAPKPEWMKYV